MNTILKIQVDKGKVEGKSLLVFGYYRFYLVYLAAIHIGKRVWIGTCKIGE